jgi:hypothetical protein
MILDQSEIISPTGESFTKSILGSIPAELKSLHRSSFAPVQLHEMTIRWNLLLVWVTRLYEDWFSE